MFFCPRLNCKKFWVRNPVSQRKKKDLFRRFCPYLTLTDPPIKLLPFQHLNVVVSTINIPESINFLRQKKTCGRNVSFLPLQFWFRNIVQERFVQMVYRFELGHSAIDSGPFDTHISWRPSWNFLARSPISLLFTLTAPISVCVTWYLSVVRPNYKLRPAIYDVPIL